MTGLFRFLQLWKIIAQNRLSKRSKWLANNNEQGTYGHINQTCKNIGSLSKYMATRALKDKIV